MFAKSMSAIGLTYDALPEEVTSEHFDIQHVNAGWLSSEWLEFPGGELLRMPASGQIQLPTTRHSREGYDSYIGGQSVHHVFNVRNCVPNRSVQRVYESFGHV